VNEITAPSRRVRPAFMRGSAIAVALLLPILVHSVWGYIETRRLDRAIQSIQAKGEPVQLRSEVPLGDASTAARFYRAAAALASHPSPDQRGRFARINDAERTGEWPDDALSQLRVIVGSHEEMLSFVDRAADMPFEDFGPGTTHSYFAADLINAIRLSLLRAVVKAYDGDGDGAARSLYSGVRAGRWFSRSGPWYVPYSLWVAPAVTVTLERSRASDAELERLARALADSDNDDVLRQAFLMMRAGIIREDSISNRWVIGSRAAPAFVVDKPWQTRQFNRQLAWYAEVLDAVDMPWPARIDAIDRVDYFNLDGPFTRERMKKYVENVVSPLAMVRSFRTAVAVERFQHAHAGQLPASLSDMVPSYLPSTPVDPFTGQPIRFSASTDAYVVYSAGLNRTDDDGDVAMQWARGSDLGIRVRYVDRERRR
jgi:hypothetical protein